MKLDHELAQAVIRGDKTSTWRLFDDKDLSVNDEVRLIDKVDPEHPETWRVIGTGMIHRVIQKRLGDTTAEDTERHHPYASTDEMLAEYRQFYGNDVTSATTVKIIHFIYKPPEQSGEAEITTLLPEHRYEKVKIYADGGSRGNPGPSASGFVIIDPSTDKVIVDKGVYLGVTTNNQAEYLALKFALEEVHKMGAREIDVYLDSMLVVNQMKGIFKVKNRDLWPIHESINELVGSFERVTFTHVPRELNTLADAAVNRALDEHLQSTSSNDESDLPHDTAELG